MRGGPLQFITETMLLQSLLFYLPRVFMTIFSKLTDHFVMGFTGGRTNILLRMSCSSTEAHPLYYSLSSSQCVTVLFAVKEIEDFKFITYL